jgi:hypothetical protein
MNADKQKIMQDIIAALQTNDPALKKMLQCSNVSEQDCLLEKNKKHGEMQKWHQRHNLTVLSRLPLARSGAVG